MTTQTPREDRFEDRLLAAILDDFENLTAAPSSTGGPLRLRQLRRPAGIRRVPHMLVAGGATVAIAAAGVLALALHAPGRPSSPPVKTHAQTASYLVDRMRAAVDGDTAVLNIVEHAPDSETGKPVSDETWSTPHGDTTRFENLDAAGNPIDGYVVTITAHRTVSIHIDYQARTWSKTTYSFGSASSAPGPAPLPVTPKQSAARLRAQVAAGQMTVVGPETVDGQQSIHLKEVSDLGELDLWVDPATYLPIREISAPPGAPLTSSQAIRDDYVWLPDTPANLRLVTAAAAIPPGFTEVGG